LTMLSKYDTIAGRKVKEVDRIKKGRHEMATKVLTWETLKQLNESSIKAGRNRNLYFEKLPIKREEFYPIFQAFPHNDMREWRLRIILNQEGDAAYLDVSSEEYEAIHLVDNQ